MTLVTRNRYILAGIEASYGTPETLTGADAIRVMDDLEVSPLQMELVDRAQLYGYVGNSPRIPAQKLTAVNFSFELTGSGTAGTAPKTGIFFRASGHSETIVPGTSVTYAPIGTGYEGITINAFYAGKQHVIAGVRGNVSLDLSVGSIPMGRFEGLGFYATPTDVSAATLTYDDQADPLVMNSDNTPTVSAFSYAACLQSFQFNAGRSPVLHQRAGCSKEIRIDGERNPEGTAVIESVLMATKNYFTPAEQQTLGAISWTHNATAGNIVSFSAPTCSLGDISYGDQDGVEMLNLPFITIPTAADGYDDYSLAFT